MSENEIIKKISKPRKSNKRNKERCLTNIILELNFNLKKNTKILTEMKQSISNLSFYKDGQSASHIEVCAIKSKFEKDNGSSEAINDIDDKCLADSPNNLKEISKGPLSTGTGDEIVKVDIRIVFLKLGEIDTVKEQFQAEVFIEAKWKEPNLRIEDLESFDPNVFWNPMIEIQNAVGDIKSDVSHKIILEKDDSIPVIYEMRKLKGTFLENLELYDFPVDVQDLTVTLTTSRVCSELAFFQDNEIPSSINTQAFIDQQEWKLYDHVEVSKRDITKEKNKSPSISFTCHASRRPGYFYWNVYFLIFFITIMIFATFSVKPNLPQNRLQLSFTLLLTAVTFKFVVNRCLPTISYLTSLDKYVLASMFLLCVICSWHAFISMIDHLDVWNTFDGFVYYSESEYKNYLNITKNPTPQDVTYYYDKDKNQTMVKKSLLTTAERYDRYALFFFGSSYVASHIIFVTWMYFSVYKRRRAMKLKDQVYLELINQTKPVVLEEYELSGSKNHLMRTNKTDINDTTQRKGIKGMINSELKKNIISKRAFSVRGQNDAKKNLKKPFKKNTVGNLDIQIKEEADEVAQF